MMSGRQNFFNGRLQPVEDAISPQSLDGIPNGRTRNLSLSFARPTPTVSKTALSKAFSNLPREVIQRILWTVDADGFASLALLNRTWNMEAQSLDLYAYHLSRCPSYALANNVITGPFRRNDLFRLKTKFAAEVRRNLFEAYMRPRETLVNLISINASSSAAFPGGEAFRFAFSPNGQTVLALGSSRIYVLDVTSNSIVVQKELKTSRRPFSASITDDGSLLAVLSSRHQVNVYALTLQGPKHMQVLVLDNPCRTIAIAHEGTVLSAAYEGGVEVFSLASNALSTDRRSVRSEAVDTLTFSGDGSMLVGSSQRTDEPNAVVITAPFYTENDPDLNSREIHSRMWTTQILFPQISSICSHAELLQGHNEGDASWLFAYDHSLMTYRAVRTDDTRMGVAYFLSPSVSRRFSMPLPSTAPAASACGTLVVAGFGACGLSLYGVPERLDISPDMGSVVERHEARIRGTLALTSATGHVEPLMAYSPSISGSSDEIEDDSIAAKVDWRQSLFVKCRQVKAIQGYTAAKWVERSEKRPCEFNGKRLVVVAPGGVSAFGEHLGDENMPVDGSRICLLDFDYAPSQGENRVLTIEVGEREPELLPEYSGNLDVEIQLERRRSTVRNSLAFRDRDVERARLSLGRSMTAAVPHNVNYFAPASRRTSVSQPPSPGEVGESQGSSPQLRPSTVSSMSIQRSATAAGFQTARYPPRPPLGQNYPNMDQVVDAPPRPQNNWESPPPSYPQSTHGPPVAFSSPTGDTYYPVPRTQANNRPHSSSTESGIPERGAQSNAQAGNNPTGFLAPVNEGVTYQAYRPATRVPGPAGETYHALQVPVQNHSHPSDSQHSLNTRPSQQALRQPTDSITLSGANLQNRLNHPVPPVPSSPEQRRREMVAQQNSGNQQPRQPTWPGDTTDQYHFVNPSPDQMANLHRRVSSGSRQQPLTINTARANGTASHDFGMGPPRAALGAKGSNSPKSLGRNNSRGSQRSIPVSQSTPNLATQRPKYGRLDTIESVASALIDVAGGRSRSFGSPTPYHNQNASAYEQNQQRQQQQRMSPENARRIVSDPVTETTKKKKGKNKKGTTADENRSQSALEVRPAKEKKGSRCIVM